MPKFRCWIPENGDGEHGYDIEARDACEAAEDFAEEYDADNSEHPDERTVAVRDKDGTVTTFIVEAEDVRRYDAYEV